MQEVFEFSSADIARLLLAELVRLGKADATKTYGVTTIHNIAYGRDNSITVKLGDPVPGAASI